MTSHLRLGAVLLSLYLTQAALSGCGSPSAGATTDSSAGASASGSQSVAAQGGAVTFSRPRPRATAATKAEREKAGNAASFVAPGADNSVPTFGSEASAVQRESAEANLRAYLTARAARRWARACSLLAATVRRGYEKLAKSGANCAKLLPVLAPLRAGEPANPLRGALVAFRTQGAHAFALFYGPLGHQQYMVPMNREDGAWRPTQPAPIAYPPAAP
jgi:hypothetical protein